MELTGLLVGIIPLIVFVIVDAFTGVRTALIVAVLLALAEFLFSLLYFKEIDFITVFAVVLVIVFAFVSYKKNNSIHFKLQPVVLSCLFGIVFLVSFLLGKPLLLMYADKYQSLFSDQIRFQLQHPLMREMLRLNSHYLAYSFFLHAIVTAWAAFKWSNWWWIFLRSIGFYFFLFLSFLLSKIQLESYNY